MPIYEYECTQCGRVSDIRHGFKESAGACTVCGGQLKRIFHASGIVFKGSGFYVTDSRKPSVSTTPSKSKSSGDSDSSKQSDSAKSDSSSGDSSKSDAPKGDSKSSQGSEAAA